MLVGKLLNGSSDNRTKVSAQTGIIFFYQNEQLKFFVNKTKTGLNFKSRRVHKPEVHPLVDTEFIGLVKTSNLGQILFL